MASVDFGGVGGLKQPQIRLTRAILVVSFGLNSDLVNSSSTKSYEMNLES